MQSSQRSSLPTAQWLAAGGLTWVLAIACASVPTRAPQTTAPRESLVLFVCEHGVAKSVVASTLFNQMARERGLPFRAEFRSSGEPQQEPSVATVKGLQADGLPTPADPPGRVSAEDIRRAVHVVGFDVPLPESGAEAGKIEQWRDVPAVGQDYAAARDLIRAHLPQLLHALTTGQASSGRAP